MPKSLKAATGCNSDDDSSLREFATSGRVADFDTARGHSFDLMKEFLGDSVLDTEAFFDDQSLVSNQQIHLPVHLLRTSGGPGITGHHQPYALAFTRRWKAGQRPDGAIGDNGTLIVIAIRHREDCEHAFRMELTYEGKVMSFGQDSKFECDTEEFGPRSLALVINITDSKLKSALRSVGAHLVTPGRHHISLIAECVWTYQEEDGWGFGAEKKSVTAKCSVGVGIPPDRDELPFTFNTEKLLEASAEDLLTWGSDTLQSRSIEPLTVGFEFEDAGVCFPGLNMKTCRHHKARVPKYEEKMQKAKLIVSSDIPAQQRNAFCDLEIKSLPFDLFDNKSIVRFVSLYKVLYQDLGVIEGLKVTTGQQPSIQPQVTISVPFKQICSFIEAAPLIWPMEEAAIMAFRSIHDAIDYRSLKGQRTIVDTVGELLTYYLVQVWPNVGRPLLAMKKGLLRSEDGMLDLANKAYHSLFLKDVDRDGVKLNGVVDLYCSLRKELHDATDFPVVLIAMLDAVTTWFSRSYRQHCLHELIELADGMDTDSINSIRAFNTSYVDYLEREARRVYEQQGAYTPNPFTGVINRTENGLDVLLKRLGVTVTFTSLTEVRDHLITPAKGQSRCTYFEERRLATFLRDRAYACSTNVAKRGIVRVLMDLGDARSNKSHVQQADLSAKAALLMVRYYRQFFKQDPQILQHDTSSDIGGLNESITISLLPTLGPSTTTPVESDLRTIAMGEQLEGTPDELAHAMGAPSRAEFLTQHLHRMPINAVFTCGRYVWALLHVSGAWSKNGTIWRYKIQRGKDGAFI